jgi:uncharacterized protein
MTIAGYAIVFNAPSEVLREGPVRFVEVIKPEAVTAPLAGNPDIRALVDHDSSKVLGRTTSGTLKYRVDERGVFVEIEAPDTTYANDLVAVMGRRDVDGFSFGFSVAPGGDAWDTSGALPVRSVTRIARITEFSAVTFPAYPQTEASVRARAVDRAGSGTEPPWTAAKSLEAWRAGTHPAQTQKGRPASRLPAAATRKDPGAGRLTTEAARRRLRLAEAEI